MAPESWETAWDPEDDNLGDARLTDPWYKPVTVNELHRLKVLTCPICGDDRPLERAEDPYCDEACEWIATNDRPAPLQICAADDCNEIVFQSAGPGRPRTFHSKTCKERQMKRLQRERDSAS